MGFIHLVYLRFPGLVLQRTAQDYVTMSEPMDICTKIGYVKRLELYKMVKPYWLNVPVFPEDKMHNIEYEYVEGIKVADIRDWMASFHLDKHGFEIVNHSSALTYGEFSSDGMIYAHYFPESEALLRKHLDAARVFALEHQIRRHPKGMEDNPVLVFNQVLTGAHCGQLVLCALGKRIAICADRCRPDSGGHGY